MHATPHAGRTPTRVKRAHRTPAWFVTAGCVPQRLSKCGTPGPTEWAPGVSNTNMSHCVWRLSAEMPDCLPRLTCVRRDTRRSGQHTADDGSREGNRAACVAALACDEQPRRLTRGKRNTPRVWLNLLRRPRPGYTLPRETVARRESKHFLSHPPDT
jgi:hypothetical protein